MDQQQHIDALLERYLGLLDEYTQLRKSLSEIQSNVYQNIARANFAGERGMRYGQDHYDERMQAIRLLDIEVDEKEIPSFSIIDAPIEEPEKEEKAATEGKDGESEDKAEEDSTKEPTQKKPKKNRNPLHWYGIFAPMPLRTAQTQSVQAVEKIIPRLVSVNAEMLNVEIEVRRARKRRAKATAKNEGETTANTQSQTAPLEAS
ncbi:Hypothetical protein NCS54_01046300 [Fusarium falciforme]|uniref:Hypothetical protein n=1 Tax=Fusarium falciforme TaxID=195108 RepID=UPI002300F10D|nr:Hypothetical protein NCS54_01046300 [Fusarium falciforme]WAO92935.1 Hypothetical protein NCS54_01046300 [Fusarium falciforme]